MPKRYWLMKSEPDTFSYEDLTREPKKTAHWDGVRNYQARNMMRDEMKKGDGVLFYHSNAKPPHIAGVAEVAKEGYPDHTAFDANEKYFDPKSDPENPRWYMVDVKAVRALDPIIPLDVVKENPKLDEMKLVQKGQRLSVQPVTKQEWDEVLRMEKRLKKG
jgi:predicted RNA-binding protein with PUA-like domain